jgi:hypothetical protein
MKKLAYLVVVGALVIAYSYQHGFALPNAAALASTSNSVAETAFKNKQSHVQLQGQGIVVKLLADDVDGSRHQKFILKMRSGLTVLIAHNIDLAARINNLKIGDTVEFYGEYEWNKKGGVIHWTHHDPANKHPHGWLKHQGKLYQ